MASYNEDHGIREDSSQRRSNTGSSRNNADIDSFFSSSRTTSAGHPASVNSDMFRSAANLFETFLGNQSNDSAHFDLVSSLISQLLTEANEGSTGAPPVSQEFLVNLPTTSHSRIPKDAECPICGEDFFQGRSEKPLVTTLRCGHHYDKECIIPWLKLHNTCPACRKTVEGKSEEEKRKEAEEAARLKAEDEEEDYDMMYG